MLSTDNRSSKATAQTRARKWIVTIIANNSTVKWQESLCQQVRDGRLLEYEFAFELNTENIPYPHYHVYLHFKNPCLGVYTLRRLFQEEIFVDVCQNSNDYRAYIRKNQYRPMNEEEIIWLPLSAVRYCRESSKDGKVDTLVNVTTNDDTLPSTSETLSEESSVNDHDQSEPSTSIQKSQRKRNKPSDDPKSRRLVHEKCLSSATTPDEYWDLMIKEDNYMFASVYNSFSKAIEKNFQLRGLNKRKVEISLKPPPIKFTMEDFDTHEAFILARFWEKSKKAQKPLWIYGRTGTGKTRYIETLLGKRALKLTDISVVEEFRAEYHQFLWFDDTANGM